MTDEKRPDANLLFTLRGPMSEEVAREWEETRRQLAADILSACTPTHEAVEAMRASWAATFALFAHADFKAPNLSGVALACEEAARVSQQIGVAVAGIVRQATETANIFAEAVAAMPADEREELRHTHEDAPLCEVDVNASAVM